MGEIKGVYRVLVGKSEGKDHLEDPEVYGRIILRWIFRNFCLSQERSSWRALAKCGKFCD
jgi:hypothetical protein